MTYNVFGRTLNRALSICLSIGGNWIISSLSTILSFLLSKPFLITAATLHFRRTAAILRVV